jgi:GNAT superfamily N-acetyltransferase
MKIREATLSDAAVLADLSTQLGYPAIPEQTAERLTTLASRPGNGVLVAENDGGTVVGWLHVSVMFFLESPPFAEVAGLIVDEAHRGQGAGKLLLDAAARWAADHGYDKLRVRSNVIREDAHRFYEREGFRRVKTQVVLDRAL